MIGKLEADAWCICGEVEGTANLRNLVRIVVVCFCIYVADEFKQFEGVSLTKNCQMVSFPGRCNVLPTLTESMSCAQQVICGQNCTFIITSNGTVLACGEGSYGRLGQGNSDDLHTPTLISTLQGTFKMGCEVSIKNVFLL